MNRRCPRCLTDCQPRTSGGVEVDLCPACGGVFLDATEFDALVAERFEGTRLESMFAIMAEDVAEPPACPSCQGAMQQVIYEDIEIDRCPNCEGIWLDGDERRMFAERAAAAAEPPPPELLECGGCGATVPKRACIRRMGQYWCEECVVAGRHPGPEAALIGVADMRQAAAVAMAQGKVRQADTRSRTQDRLASHQRMRRRFKPLAQDGATLEIIARWVNRVLDKFD